MICNPDYFSIFNSVSLFRKTKFQLFLFMTSLPGSIEKAWKGAINTFGGNGRKFLRTKYKYERQIKDTCTRL